MEERAKAAQLKDQVEVVKTQLVQAMKIEEEVQAAQRDVKEYEYELINAKLNLDAIEIDSTLAGCFS